jgi:hypothetical protein
VAGAEHRLGGGIQVNDQARAANIVDNNDSGRQQFKANVGGWD